MKSERKTIILFDDLMKKAQKRIIAEELGRVTDETVSHVVVTMDLWLYGYCTNPKDQTLEQRIHTKVRYAHHDHHWLMVWNCMDAEFTTVMKED